MFDWLLGKPEPKKQPKPRKNRRAARVLMVKTLYATVPVTSTRSIAALEKRGWKRRDK